jgi:hypothetical protein
MGVRTDRARTRVSNQGHAQPENACRDAMTASGAGATASLERFSANPWNLWNLWNDKSHLSAPVWNLSAAALDW